MEDESQERIRKWRGQGDIEDAPTTVDGEHDGFVIFDSRALMYYAGATNGKSEWTQHASGAFVFPDRKSADKTRTRQRLCFPSVFVHPIKRADIGQELGGEG